MKVNRRTVLKGSLAGASVGVGIPLLDCFLNANGTALANGAALPPIFGTWFQSLGFTPGRWRPDAIGRDYESKAEMKPLDAFKARMNLISGCQYFMDGRPVETHITGVQIGSTGAIPVGVISAPSIDDIVAGMIGARTRFRSLEVSLTGNRESASRRVGSASNSPSEPSPAALYARIFGPEFRDPNALAFEPDVRVMARRSVLSAVSDARRDFSKALGASDRTRLEEYFTSIRQLEQQLELDLQKPAPLEYCARPGTPAEGVVGPVTDDVARNATLFGGLIANAVACDQTRVFNLMMGQAGNVRQAGSIENWHGWTHEEPIDPQAGYQVIVAWYSTWAAQVFADFLTELDKRKEGSGSVLDRAVVLWQTDHGIARSHTMDNLPIIAVGSAGGRLKTGMHINTPGDPSTRVGLTLQQALGVPAGTWGALSNATSKTMTEILA